MYVYVCMYIYNSFSPPARFFLLPCRELCQPRNRSNSRPDVRRLAGRSGAVEA